MTVNPLFLITGAGMIAVGVTSVVFWKVRQKVPLSIFVWGALVWVVGVAAKSAVSVPSQSLIGIVRNTFPTSVAEPLLWTYAGLLTGIFECGATVVFVRMKRFRKLSWDDSVGFGLGFGAIEAILLGIVSFVVILLVILIPDKLPSKLVEQTISGTQSIFVIPAGIVERIIAIFVHAFSCVLIIYAVREGEWRWFWLSFFYKSVIDGIAGYVHLTHDIENLTTSELWLLELGLLPFGLVGLWGLWIFRTRWKDLA